MNTLQSLPTARAGRDRIADRTMRQTFVLELEHGLHARPCALLVKTLRAFRCRVEVETNGMLANGHSLMGLMALAAGNKTKMTFAIAGEEAAQAMSAVSYLFETRFEDAYSRHS